MKTLHQIREDLRAIRFYYEKKSDLERGTKHIGESAVVQLVEKYNAGAKALCEKYGAEYIDVMALFDKGMEDNHPVRYTWDRVHPSLGGHMMIAREFLKKVGADLG